MLNNPNAIIEAKGESEEAHIRMSKITKLAGVTCAATGSIAMSGFVASGAAFFFCGKGV